MPGCRSSRCNNAGSFGPSTARVAFSSSLRSSCTSDACRGRRRAVASSGDAARVCGRGSAGTAGESSASSDPRVPGAHDARKHARLGSVEATPAAARARRPGHGRPKDAQAHGTQARTSSSATDLEHRRRAYDRTAPRAREQGAQAQGARVELADRRREEHRGLLVPSREGAQAPAVSLCASGLYVRQEE